MVVNTLTATSTGVPVPTDPFQKQPRDSSGLLGQLFGSDRRSGNEGQIGVYIFSGIR